MPATVTVVNAGPGEFEVTIDETSATSTSEVEITGVPILGVVKRVQIQLVSGAGTTVQPILGRVTNPAAAPITDWVVEPISDPADAAPAIDRCGGATYRALTVTGGQGTLYHRSRVDAGSNNTIQTVYHIKAGW